MTTESNHDFMGGLDHLNNEQRIVRALESIKDTLTVILGYLAPVVVPSVAAEQPELSDKELLAIVSSKSPKGRK